MITLATNENNDIYLDEFGNLKTVDGLEAIIQVCEQVSRTLKGEMKYSINTGLPYQSAIVNRRDTAQFESELIKELSKVDGVISIQDVNFSQESDNLNYSVSIITQFGKTFISGALV